MTNAIITDDRIPRFVTHMGRDKGYVAISNLPYYLSRRDMNKILPTVASWVGKYTTTTIT